MEYLCYSVAAIALLYIAGLGFAILLVPESLRRYILILAPWLGFCYISLACWPVFFYGGKIGPQTAKLLLIPPVLCLAIALTRKRRQKLWQAILYGPTLGALGITAAAFVVLSIPAFWNINYLTTVSLGNNDIASYGLVSRYLSEFSRYSTEGFVGQLALGPNPLQRVALVFYFGTSALTAFAGGVLGLMPHEDLSMFTFMFSTLGGTVVFVLLHERLRVGVAAALLGVGFVAFHPMLQFIALEGFFAQVVGTGLGLLIFWGNAKLLDRNNTAWDRGKLCLLVTVFTCGMLLNYAHMLIFVWFFTGIYAIALAVLERSLHPIKICIGANIVIALLSAAILPQRVGPFLEIFKIYGTATAGWFIPLMAPDYLVGLMYKNPFLEIGTDWRWRLAGTVFVGLGYFVTVYIAYRKGHRQIVAVGLASFAVYAGCFLLAVMDQENGVWGGYKSFKLASYFLPFFGCALISLCTIATARLGKIGIRIQSIALVAVITGYVMADYVMLRPARCSKVEPNYESLRGLERTSSVKSINVSSGDYWPTMWVAYFLIHKKLYLENPSYYIMSEPLGDYDLVDKVSLTSDIVRVKRVEAPVVQQINERFTLVGPVKRRVRAKLGTGWYLGEVGLAWCGKNGKRTSIILHTLDDGVRVRLRFVYSPLRANDRLMLEAGGETLNATAGKDSKGREEINVSNLALKKGDTEVDIISELEPTQPNATDPRPVSYCFSAVEVEEL
jgi:hypothetical protein